MGRIARQSAAELAEELLRKDVLSGRWDDVLPSSRLLASELGVSAPTVGVALGRLAAEGLIERPGPRRRYRIAVPGSGRREIPQNARHVVFLTHKERAGLPEPTRRVLEQARLRLSRKGWVVEFRDFDFMHAKAPRRTWDQLVPEDRSIPLVAVFGRQAVVRWAAERGQRIALLGGVSDDPRTVVIGVRSALLASDAVARLVALGHRRIVMPLCDRPPSFAEALKHAMRSGLESAGGSYVPGYHTPESPFPDKGVIWRILEKAFATRPPTALIMLDWREMVTTGCFLSALGLRIGEDVSVVLLNEQSEADWFAPKLACYRFPTVRLANRVVRWVDRGLPGAGRIDLNADFDPGESIRADASAEAGG